MRTDAKIGFAIGGVLLAVLTVYAIVIPKHKKTTAANTVSLVTPVPSTPAPTDNSSTSTPPPFVAADAGSNPPPPAAVAPVTAAPAATVINPTNNTPPMAENASVLPAPTDGFHPLTSTTDLPKSDDQKPSKLVDGVYTPEHSTAKVGKTRHSSPAIQDETEASSAGDTLYTIKPGQTLSKIAYEVYGNSRFWVVIQRENKGIDSNHLKVGSKVKLPDISSVVPGPVTVSDDEVAPMNVASGNAVSARRAVSGGVTDARTYTVKSGDSLYGIARRLLGSGHKADALYAMNKEVIGADKSKLKLGMVLKLPETTRAPLAD